MTDLARSTGAAAEEILLDHLRAWLYGLSRCPPSFPDDMHGFACCMGGSGSMRQLRRSESNAVNPIRGDYPSFHIQE